MSGQKNEGGPGGQAGPEKRKRRNPEQIIAKLREIDADLGGGLTIEAIARKHGVSTVTIGRWREVFGGVKGPEIKRLKELESENARLKRVVADLTLDIVMLKDVAAGKF
jgi:putative transposase